jgi:hypothetical protein
MQELPVIAGTLPDGVCYDSYNEMAQAFASIYSVVIPDSQSSIVVSSTKPTSDKEGNSLWQRLDALGRPEHIYWFAAGAWLSLHPFQPGFIVMSLTLPDFTTYDGGDANAISPISGPMWQLANTALDGSGTQILGGTLTSQMPLGVGTLASGAAVTSGLIGGEEKHILTGQEMPPHGHAPTLGGGGNFLVAGSGTNPTPSGAGGTTGFVSVDAVAGGDPATGTPPTKALAHNTLPPFCGVYFLMRTLRQFYSVN